MDKRMRIGELVRRAGVTQRTVRHYESIFLNNINLIRAHELSPILL
jgi:hypothetical protein